MNMFLTPRYVAVRSPNSCLPVQAFQIKDDATDRSPAVLTDLKQAIVSMQDEWLVWLQHPANVL